MKTFMIKVLRTFSGLLLCLSCIVKAATNLENLEKSENLTVVRENSGKVEKIGKSQVKCVLLVVCYCDCSGHRISIA